MESICQIALKRSNAKIKNHHYHNEAEEVSEEESDGYNLTFLILVAMSLISLLILIVYVLVKNGGKLVNAGRVGTYRRNTVADDDFLFEHGRLPEVGSLGTAAAHNGGFDGRN